MAEYKDFSEDLENMVTCPICKKILTEPKALPCLHTFCLTCIQSWNQTCQSENQPFKCPTCRKPTTVDVENLPTSFHHNTLIQKYNDQLNEYKRLIRKEREKSLKRWQKKFTKKMDLSKQERKDFDDEIDLAQGEVRRNTLLQIKILQDHEEAMITRLNDIHTTNKAENDEEQSQLNETIQRIDNLADHLEDMNAEQFRSKEFQQLLGVCNTTVKEASNLYKETLKRYPSVHYIPNEVAIKSMQDLQFGKVVQSMIDPSQCSIESIRQARCGFSNHFNIVTKDTEGDVCFTSEALIDVQIQDIDGNDVHKEVTESETGRYIVKYKAQKPSQYKVKVTIGGTSISNSPQNVETIDANAELEPVQGFETITPRSAIAIPSTLAVSDTYEVAVVHNDPNVNIPYRVALFSADGEYLREIGGEGIGESLLRCPFGVAFNGDRLLVSDNHDGYGCIKEFDIHGNFRRTIHKQEGVQFRRMSTTEQSIACLTSDVHNKETSIKLFSKQTCDLLQDIKLDIHGVGFFLAYGNNRYFVTFRDNKSIYVFNEDGRRLDKIGEEDNKEGQFDRPWGLAVFSTNKLLVCDAYNHRVHLLDQDNEFIRSFENRGSGLGKMRGPVDVVVTPNGQVFVLEADGRRIQVFR